MHELFYPQLGELTQAPQSTIVSCAYVPHLLTTVNSWVSYNPVRKYITVTFMSWCSYASLDQYHLVRSHQNITFTHKINHVIYQGLILNTSQNRTGYM